MRFEITKRQLGWVLAAAMVLGPLGVAATGSPATGEAAPTEAPDSVQSESSSPAGASQATNDNASAPPGTLPDSAPVDMGSLVTYQDTPVGFTEEGFPFRGDPEAPVTLVEYSDYLCPYCARHFSQTLPTLLDTYVRPGKVRLVFRDFPIASLHPTAAKGAAAALCVAEQGPVLFWKMHDALFLKQREWNRLPDPSEFLADTAKGVGAEPAAYAECLASGRTAARVDESVAAANALGFNGTPSFQFVRTANGDAYTLVGAQPTPVFAQWADALVVGKAPPEPKKPELPFWAKPEGLAPDPKRPGWTVAGDPYKGDPQAKLTVVEFTDFQCAACRKHGLETQPVLDKEFVETGKVQWVTKHLPLRIHPHAPAAAAAAECAADQGRFWDMQYSLYEKQDQWGGAEAEAETDAALVGLSETLGLEMAGFTQCFNGRKVLERVLDDLYDAQGVARTTPTFIVIHGGSGAVLRGTRAADSFVAILQKHYEAAAAAEDKATEAGSGHPAAPDTGNGAGGTDDPRVLEETE